MGELAALLPTMSPKAVSALGDPWLLLGLTAGLAVMLALRVDRAAAAAWLATVVVAVTTVALVKVLGYAVADWAALPRNPFNPSGHAAFAALVHAGLALQAWRAVAGRGAIGRIAGLLIAGVALTATGAVAWSRVALGAHTPAESIVGMAFGLAALVLAHRPGVARAVRRSGPLPWAGFAAVCAVWAALAIRDLPSERAIQIVGRQLVGLIGPVMPPADRP